MGVDIPTDYNVDVDIVGSIPPVTVTGVGPVGPVTVNGIPDTYHINIDSLPKIQLGVDPLDVSLDVRPVEVSLRLTEVPSTRTHLPADFAVGLSILGMELVSVRLCGEAQVVTEPYRPNPCEICGASLRPRTDSTAVAAVPALVRGEDTSPEAG